MVQPNLIHPVPVYVERVADADDTLWDEDANEPIGERERQSAVRLRAQVRWRSIEDPDWQWAGVDEKTRGYLVFRYRDLERRGVTIERGDRITKVGKRTVNLFVTGFEDAAHYTDLGGAGFLLAFFEDRTPAERAR